MTDYGHSHCFDLALLSVTKKCRNDNNRSYYSLTSHRTDGSVKQEKKTLSFSNWWQNRLFGTALIGKEMHAYVKYRGGRERFPVRSVGLEMNPFTF